VKRNKLFASDHSKLKLDSADPRGIMLGLDGDGACENDISINFNNERCSARKGVYCILYHL
jgi:hypothetical protein